MWSQCYAGHPPGHHPHVSESTACFISAGGCFWGKQNTTRGSAACFHWFCHSCRLPGLFENIFKPPVTGAGLQIYVQVYNR